MIGGESEGDDGVERAQSKGLIGESVRVMSTSCGGINGEELGLVLIEEEDDEVALVDGVLDRALGGDGELGEIMDGGVFASTS